MKGCESSKSIWINGRLWRDYTVQGVSMHGSAAQDAVTALWFFD